MQQIPNMLRYEEDELTYSWLLRMCYANGFNNIMEFLNSYIFDYKIRHIQYDLKYLQGLGDALNLEPPDVVERFLNTSLYPFNSLFLSPQQQTAYLNSTFRKERSKVEKGFQNNTTFFRTLNFCPLCKQEEIKEKGYFIYHRSHQLPGVRVCSKHKCLLHQYKGVKGHEFDSDISSQPLVLRDDIDIEQKYSCFVKELIEANFDSDIFEINSIVLEKLFEKNLTFKSLPQLIKEKNMEYIFSGIKYKNFKKVTFKKMNGSFENDVCVTLMCLFDTANEIPISTKSISIRNFDELSKLGYTLLSKYRNNIVALRHEYCGNSFICTGTAIQQGWYCPKCDNELQLEDIIHRVISKIDENSYVPLDAFNGIGSKCRFHHKKCGHIIDTSPGELIYGIRRCPCSYEDEARIKERVECRKEYILLNYEKDTNIVTVKNIFCNHVFKAPFNELMKDRRCRLCYPEPIDTEERFKDVMKSLVGDEYELIGPFYYDSALNLKFLHKECNQITEMNVEQFLVGHRCKHCGRWSEKNIYAKIIPAVSNGRYEFINNKRDGSFYFTSIRDNHTKEIIKIYSPLLKQELCRPTLSPVLVGLDKTQNTSNQTNRQVSVLTYIQNNYKKNDVIRTRDVQKTLAYGRPLIHKTFKRFEERNIVKRIDRGVYLLN